MILTQDDGPLVCEHKAQSIRWANVNSAKKRQEHAEIRAAYSERPEVKSRITADYEESKLNKRKRQNAAVGRYQKKMMATSPEFRLVQRMRKRARTVLQNASAEKSASTIALLGCTGGELKDYFQSRFSEGMTWELFMQGEIHIDHIRPCVSFNLKEPSEQAKCFHYTNLQPLWAGANRKKQSRWQGVTLRKKNFLSTVIS